MPLYTDGTPPWNSADDNTRAPLASELEGGYPCGEADQKLFNWTTGWSLGNIWNMILESGIVPSVTKLLDLARAIQTGKVNYAVATGTADALVVNLSPVPASLTAGMRIRVKIGALPNSGPATLKVNAFAAIPVVTLRNSPIVKDDLPAGSICTFTYNGASWMFSGVSYGEIRQVLQGPLTLYVRTDGNDNNTGLANTAGEAFATIAGAWNKIKMLDTSSYAVTIQLAPGSYVGFQFPYYIGTIRLKGGDSTTKNNYNIGVATGQSFVFRNSVRNLILEGVSFNYNYTGAVGGVGGLGEFTIGAYDQSSVAVIDCNYNCASARVQLNHNVVDSGCLISNTGLIGINGGVSIRDFASTIGGGIFLGSATYTTNPSPLPVNNYFAEASLGGIMNFALANFSGASATGNRYAATIGGIINTGGGGANFLPGSAAGVVATGGLYA